MSIFETDKLIILFYRPGAGGKFLANCLGLSSQAVLQDANFAQQQLDGGLDSVQKFDLIMNRLDEATVYWKDLGLGDYQYFGQSLENIVKESQLKSICKHVNDQNLFFIAVSHSIKTLERMVAMWPNAKVIEFTNSANFLRKYRNGFTDNQTRYWNKIKGPDWPDTPPGSVKEIHALPQNIQDELATQFQDLIYKNIETVPDDVCAVVKNNHQIMFTWDCDWYLDPESTAQSVEKIYNLLGLTDFNPDWIKLYWSKWVEKLHLPQEFL